MLDMMVLQNCTLSLDSLLTADTEVTENVEWDKVDNLIKLALFLGVIGLELPQSV